MDYSSMTLGEWIPLWLTSYKSFTIKETSYHQLEILAGHIPDDLKAMQLSDIRPMHIQQFYNLFSLEFSKSYMDKLKGMIKSMFADAVDNELCERNPTLRVNASGRPEKHRDSFTLEEVKAILEFSMTYQNRRIAVGVATLLLTGLRRGELLGLKWSDLKDGFLHVNRSVYLVKNKPVVTESIAKTLSSIRPVPLIPEISYLIQSLPKTGPYIFGTKNGTLMHPRNFSRDYKRFFELLHEVYPSVRYLSAHCCRHTFASLMLDSGTDVLLISRILGHTDIKTTSRYTHPDLETMRKAVMGFRDKL